MNLRCSHSFLLVAAISLLVGCGNPALAPSDPDAAQRLLGSTLEAWKSGKSVADMRESTPPIYVAEELWNDGFELHDFVIEDKGEMNGPNVLLKVTLTGSSQGGEVGKKQMQYLVTTTPACTIARADR